MSSTVSSNAPVRTVVNEPQYVARYRIGVVPVTLRTNSRRLAAVYDDCYGPFRTAAHAAGAPVVALDAFGRGSRWTRDHRWEINADHALKYALRRFDEVLPHLDWACNRAIAMNRPDLLQVHAACVARRGAAAVLAGAPESGKTTLAAALTLGGWHYLCDEFALFDPGTRAIQPFPKALCIKEPSFALLRGLRRRLPLRVGCHRREGGRIALLPPHRIRTDAVGGPGEVRLIAFPHRQRGATPAAREISPAEALFRLNALSFNFLDFRERGIDLLEHVVRRARSFVLTVGEIGATVGLVESLMDAACTSCGPWRATA